MNKIVLVVILVGVIAILIGCFVDLGLTVYKANELEKNTKFPPWPAKCPDYWEIVEDNEEGPVCANVHGIGDCKKEPHDNKMNFNHSLFKGPKGIYYKCDWSKKCKSPWEGVDSVC